MGGQPTHSAQKGGTGHSETEGDRGESLKAAEHPEAELRPNSVIEALRDPYYKRESGGAREI